MAKGSGRHFRDKSRGKPQRKRKPVVLLIAEGQNKTEKLYFWHFSTPESKYAVKVVSRGETGPQGMLASLQRECMENDVSAEDDIAGIILDLDCNEERARQLRELLCQEEYAHYKAFASNPCFEVWFVAHFHELRGTYSGSSQVLEDLKRQLPDYDKGRDCYRKLKDHTQEAIERCKAKERQYKDRNWPSGDCNPRTDVAELVELLTKLLLALVTQEYGIL